MSNRFLANKYAPSPFNYNEAGVTDRWDAAEQVLVPGKGLIGGKMLVPTQADSSGRARSGQLGPAFPYKYDGFGAAGFISIGGNGTGPLFGSANPYQYLGDMPVDMQPAVVTPAPWLRRSTS